METLSALLDTVETRIVPKYWQANMEVSRSVLYCTPQN